MAGLQCLAMMRFGSAWSPIHLLPVFTSHHAGAGVAATRRHHQRTHNISIYAGALILAGLFTLVPGRLMHEVLFGF